MDNIEKKNQPKIKISEDNLKILKDVLENNNVIIAGRVLNFIDTSDPEVAKYIALCKEEDKDRVGRRVKISEELQYERKKALKALEELKISNEQIQTYAKKLEEAKNKAEHGEGEALKNLEILSKKQQLETFDKVVRFMIYSIVGGMVLINILFVIALFKEVDNQILMTTWASTMTMVFTNAFSIIATIMGVKKIMQETKPGGDNSTTYEK